MVKAVHFHPPSALAPTKSLAPTAFTHPTVGESGAKTSNSSASVSTNQDELATKDAIQGFISLAIFALLGAILPWKELATDIRHGLTTFKLQIKEGETKERERREDQHETRTRMMDYEVDEKVEKEIEKRMARKGDEKRGEWR